MTGMVLGVMLLASTTSVSPAVETSRATVAPVVFTFHLPDGVAASRNRPRLLVNEQSRPAWRRESPQSAQATTRKHFTRTEKIIAIAAGVAGGWMAGGMIGARIADKGIDDDGVSALRGVLIGAPIGAALGAYIGHRLTK
jgi:hypothetical protein